MLDVIRNAFLWALRGTVMFLVLLAFLLLSSCPAMGQNVFEAAQNTVESHTDFTPSVSIAVWPRAHQNYQHLYEAKARGAAWWGPVEVHGYATGRFWQTDASKVVGSPVNAENNMNNEVRYGGSVRLYYRNWFFGPAIHRTEFHVVWRHKHLHGYVRGYSTPANDWRGQAERCQARNGCASIAYQDAYGGIVGYDDDYLTAEVKYLPRRWKDLTYIPVPFRGRAVLRAPGEWPVISGDWEAQVNVQRNILHEWRGGIRLRRRVVGRLWAVARAGRHQPDQKETFTRIAIGFLLR